ncbi:cob(I)yrinic acid a,c-diamide adenosyltransferase [Pelomicrobium sp.]|uniref:cob(I)yrinic acid a,c-diamide adenosyltransferase n=1 Tax=Pelomicrobium sp. TaxID=2815319 RepID=UPI002FDD9FBF
MNEGAEKPDFAERHRRRMARKKALMEARIARASEDRGVVVVLTGNGKGKSSSGFGMVARALGHGMRVGVVQFMKGRFVTGEAAFFRRFPEVDFHVMGEGYTWETQDRERDRRAARAAWEKARTMLEDSSCGLVLLDELALVLKYGHLPVGEVIAALRARPPGQHVIITGRGAGPELVAVADTVTEMRAVKHAFEAGVRAQKGIEL